MNESLNCSIRKEVGTNACHRIRGSGHVPGVIYGHYFANYPLEFDSKEIWKIIRQHGENAVVNVMINGVNYQAMIKEVQRDPISNEIIHVDLQQINTEEKIHTQIPVLLTGRENIDNDSVLQKQLQKVEVECYAQNIPENIKIDISDLQVGKSVRIADVEFGEEISVLNDDTEIIASLSFVEEEIIEDEEDEDIYYYERDNLEDEQVEVTDKTIKIDKE